MGLPAAASGIAGLTGDHKDLLHATSPGLPQDMNGFIEMSTSTDAHDGTSRMPTVRLTRRSTCTGSLSPTAPAGLFHRGAGLPILVREVAKPSRNHTMALNSRGQVVARDGLAGNAIKTSSNLVGRTLATGVPAARRSGPHETRVHLVGCACRNRDSDNSRQQRTTDSRVRRSAPVKSQSARDTV